MKKIGFEKFEIWRIVSLINERIEQIDRGCISYGDNTEEYKRDYQIILNKLL